MRYLIPITSLLSYHAFVHALSPEDISSASMLRFGLFEAPEITSMTLGTRGSAVKPVRGTLKSPKFRSCAHMVVIERDYCTTAIGVFK